MSADLMDSVDTLLRIYTHLLTIIPETVTESLQDIETSGIETSGINIPDANDAFTKGSKLPKKRTPNKRKVR